MAFGQNPDSFYLVAAFGSCPLVSVLVPVFSFACWTRRAVTLRSSSSCYCKGPGATIRVFRTLHCHIVLTSPKIILEMLVKIHSSLEGGVSWEMEYDAEFLKAEGTTVSISLQAEGHGTSLLVPCMNGCAFFRNNIGAWSKHCWWKRIHYDPWQVTLPAISPHCWKHWYGKWACTPLASSCGILLHLGPLD